MLREFLVLSVLAVLAAPAASAGTGDYPVQPPPCGVLGARAPGGAHVALYQPCRPRAPPAEGPSPQQVPPCPPSAPASAGQAEAMRYQPCKGADGPAPMAPPPGGAPCPPRSRQPTDQVQPCPPRQAPSDGPHTQFYSLPVRTAPGPVKNPCRPFVQDCFYLDG